ncbi:hypothetical protein ACA910_003678 [Epithemia clementina (nom. ined.)]
MKGKKYVRNTAIPSTPSIQRAAAIVQKYGERRFPFDHGVIDGIGEHVKFNPLHCIEVAVKSAGLENSAKQRRIQLAKSVDGAKISKNLNFVMLGIKNQDLFATDPETGDLVSVKNIQSSSIVWPVEIVMGKESSSLIQNHLAKLFRELEQCAFEGVTNEPYGWEPIKLAMNVDMSAVWKMNKCGGAMKRDEHPCHCCNIENDNIAVPNEVKDQCRWCCLLGHDQDDNKKCYHYKMLTDNVLQAMNADLAKLEELFQGMVDEVEKVCFNSQILCSDNPRVANNPRVAKKSSTNNSSSIHFKMNKNTPGEIRTEYNSKLMHNLEIQGMDSTLGNMREQQQQLHTRLIKEWLYVKLKPSIRLGNKRQAKAMFILLNTVPCILHAENRMGIKILETLLIEGLSNALKFACGGEKATALEFVKKVEKIMNNNVFGDKLNEAQWQCLLSDNKKEIVTITMNNVHTKKVIQKLDLLVEICVQDGRRREEWLRCIAEEYKGMIELMTQHRNLTTDD